MTPAPRPQPRTLPAGAGWHWLIRSLALVRAQPGRLLLLTVLMQAVLGLSQVPLLGLFIILAVPALTAGLLQAFQLADAGQPPPPSVLFAGLASSPRTGRLLALGALLFGVGIVTVSAMLSVGGALDTDTVARIEQGNLEALAQLDPLFLWQVALALAAAVSVTGLLSFLTIPLIWFSGAGVGSALATGLRAMLVNWKAFLVLSLGLAALLVPVALVVGLLFRAAGPSIGGSLLVLLLIMLILLLFQLVVFGTQYCAHRAIFGETGPGMPIEKPPESGDDGQLVA